jgi:hypothetical protein
MPSTSVISNFTNAKSYSVGSFTGIAWGNLTAALLSDSGGASSGGNSGLYTQALGMRGVAGYLQIPDSATISGIIITVVVFSISSQGSGNLTGYLDLVKATDSLAGNQKTQSFTAGSGGMYTFGASNDLWGTSWTASEVKNSEFGANLGFSYPANNFYSVSIEHVYAEIFYAYTDSTGRRGVYSTVATLRTN